MSEDKAVWLARILLLLAFFGGWELYGRLVDSTWTSEPSQIAVQIAEWAKNGLARHLAGNNKSCSAAHRGHRGNRGHRARGERGIHHHISKRSASTGGSSAARRAG